MTNEMKTIQVEYDDLDDDLKNEVKNHVLNDEYLVPFDWYEYIITALEEKYKDIIDFDKNSILFDMTTNFFNLSGNLYLENSEIEKLLPKKYFEWDKKGWFYSVDDEFVNGEMSKGYELDELSIQFFIEEDVFNYDLSDDFQNGKVEVDVKEYKPLFEKALKKYGSDSEDVAAILKKWLELIEASTLFFQETIELEEDDHNHVIGVLIDNIFYEIHDVMQNTFFEKLDEYVSNVYDEYKENLKDAYQYYFSDEYIQVLLEDRIFEVVVDEDGKQLEVVNLDGDVEF